MSDAITILIADNHPLVREGLVALLAREPDLTVVGEARDGQEAVEHAERFHPDVVLMDLWMPRLDGVAATRLIHEHQPATRLLLLSSDAGEEAVSRGLAAGACGYLRKGLPRAELLWAVRAVARGDELGGVAGRRRAAG